MICLRRRVSQFIIVRSYILLNILFRVIKFINCTYWQVHSVVFNNICIFYSSKNTLATYWSQLTSQIHKITTFKICHTYLQVIFNGIITVGDLQVILFRLHKTFLVRIKSRSVQILTDKGSLFFKSILDFRNNLSFLANQIGVLPVLVCIFIQIIQRQLTIFFTYFKRISQLSTYVNFFQFIIKITRSVINLAFQFLD
ncbi:transmembrane protein, putative (macronuclear) [Tetrahymena thermophila SB210]|uniref:Transmembrane protein, putative n=1 Tax=Tetrahymena thermophila (strain SB210) TaxID=312017 RepID=W7XI07_TETTS|nr:transmembrane protein, putative [Tetrahymena thermophila SB210]EWS74231.1 transmembrane protein, putative [Tetrahymena thermophila SB210]|eukprot:XP_012653204.1 transmembrane protein, putative [Tetrahymena thermophila SB210]